MSLGQSHCVIVYTKSLQFAKVITIRINPVLSKVISFEQFGFLISKLIHEAIGMTQEGLRTIKSSWYPTHIIKLDLSKAYKSSWYPTHVIKLDLSKAYKSSWYPTHVIKLDFSKAYDRVSWLYVRLLLLHVGFRLPLVKWIMGCAT